MKKLLKNYGFIIMMLSGVIAGCIAGALFPMVKEGDVLVGNLKAFIEGSPTNVVN